MWYDWCGDCVDVVWIDVLSQHLGMDRAIQKRVDPSDNGLGFFLPTTNWTNKIPFLGASPRAWRMKLPTVKDGEI
jgi:hypothetical protein